MLRNKQMTTLRDDHRGTVAMFCLVLIVLRRRFLRSKHKNVVLNLELSEASLSLRVSVHSPQKLQNQWKILLISRKKQKCSFRSFRMLLFFFFLANIHHK